jgi:ribosome biogenesis GTPase A
VLLETLGRRKNFLLKGNNIDEDKTARFILKDWQEGKIRK